jgi:threonine dehydratase
MQEPDLAAVEEAHGRIRPYLPDTPLLRHPGIEAALGTQVWVKHENLQPVGAFKVRGGVNLIAGKAAALQSRGVIAASTGNHGLSLAYACSLFEVPCTICMPRNPNLAKRDAIAALGARIVEEGRDFDEAREHCEGLARQGGQRYVHSGDEPDLIAGVATLTLELLSMVPDLDVLFVPVGGGSGAAGACVVARELSPRLRIIGVQSEASPAAYRSWRDGRLQEAPNSTWAEGLAVGTAFALPQAVLRAHLADFLLVSDEQLSAAARDFLRCTRTLAEGAGAAALAGAVRMRADLAGLKVGIVCSGGNLSEEQLRTLMLRGGPPTEVGGSSC